MIELHDRTGDMAGAAPMFRSHGSVIPASGHLFHQSNLTFASRDWQITVRQVAPFSSIVDRNAAAAYVAGALLITFLTFGYLVSARRREITIAQQVGIRSEELAREVDRSRLIQEALAESESQFRALFESAPVGILVSTGDEIDRANAEAMRMLRASGSRPLVGRSPFDLVDPSNRNPARQRMQSLAPGAAIEPFEIELVRLDGTRFHAVAAVSLVSIGNQPVVIRTFRDVSDEITARDALRESEEKYRHLIDLFPDSVILTRGSVITQVNDAAVRMHRAKHENELIGLDWIELVDESFHDKVYARREIMSRGELAAATDFLMKRLDGTTYWAEGRAIQVTVGGEKMFMTVSRDVTQARAAEHALMTSEENYRQLTELSPEAISVQDLDKVLFANDAAARLYGYDSAEDLVGVDALQFFEPEHRQRVRKARERILTGGAPAIGAEQTFVNARDEMKTTVTSVAAIEWSGELVCLIVNQDITSFREAQNKLQAANTELERSNEDLAQFAYVASHDLKQPLRMVSSYCQLLADRYTDVLDDRGKEFVHYAVDGAVRMRTLINDLLVYSRIGREGNRETGIDLQDVVTEVLESLEPTINETGARISVSDLPKVDGFRLEFVRLFQNLIGNALKFKADRAPVIDISSRMDADACTISVQDNGIGIPEQYLDQVFGIFRRLHNRGQFDGTGIGLAICEKIVEQMGGKIRAESEEGVGTTFVITLPVGGLHN